MITIRWDEQRETYVLAVDGDVFETHPLAASAKKYARRLGREFNDPVEYHAKSGGSKIIWSP